MAVSSAMMLYKSRKRLGVAVMEVSQSPSRPVSREDVLLYDGKKPPRTCQKVCNGGIRHSAEAKRMQIKWPHDRSYNRKPARPQPRQLLHHGLMMVMAYPCSLHNSYSTTLEEEHLVILANVPRLSILIQMYVNGFNRWLAARGGRNPVPFPFW